MACHLSDRGVGPDRPKRVHVTPQPDRLRRDEKGLAGRFMEGFVLLSECRRDRLVSVPASDFLWPCPSGQSGGPVVSPVIGISSIDEGLMNTDICHVIHVPNRSLKIIMRSTAGSLIAKVVLIVLLGVAG